MEYVSVYIASIVLIIVASSAIYLYIRTVPYPPSTCTFINGFYCKDIILQSNTMTHNTLLTVALTNTQAYLINNPKLYVSMNTTNSTTFACTPSNALPGGSIICTANVPVNTNIGTILSGDIYVNATDCGLLANYLYTGNCINAPRETYHGTFAGRTQTQLSITSTITINAVNLTQYASNGRDPLKAAVRLNGYPASGATVSFSANSAAYSISPTAINTNSTGVALSYLQGITVGSVQVTATYAGLSNSVTVRFVAAPLTSSSTTTAPTVKTSLSTTSSSTSTASTTTTSSISTTTSSVTTTSTTSTSTSTVVTVLGCNGRDSYEQCWSWFCSGAAPVCGTGQFNYCTCSSGTMSNCAIDYFSPHCGITTTSSTTTTSTSSTSTAPSCGGCGNDCCGGNCPSSCGCWYSAPCGINWCGC